MDLRDRLKETLSGSYTLERELGGGGMSRVFLAEEIALSRKVVVKVLPPDAAGSASVERFRREIALAATLQHPHIVPLLGAGESAGLLYFTMPFVRGESLRARLASHGELPVNEGIRVLREVASALAFAHAAGVVHRDIKPDNVLIAGDAAMVTDFGVAKAISAATGAGTGITSVGVALGTPAYMAPEQAAADPALDHRADIYAWGVLAYELFCGATPFAGRSAQATLSAHMTEHPEPIEKRRPNVPTGLAQLVMRCLEKRPADRPQSATEVVATLDALVTPTSTAISPSRRVRPWIVAAAGVVVIGLAGAYVALRSKSAIGSVAVMPIERVGGDTTEDYLASGLTDGIMAELTRVPGLRVAARSSAFSFKGKNASPRDISKALNVATVVLARMEHLGSRLRVSAELDSSNGDALWSGSIERNAGDPLSLRDEIVRELSGALRLKLTNAGAVAAKRHVPDPTTYDLYLHGLHWNDATSREGLEKARSYFEQAIARDSLYAPAYTGLAWSLLNLADAYLPPKPMVPVILNAAQRAVLLDSTSAWAHGTLAMVHQLYVRNREAAAREMERAFALDPNVPELPFYRSYIHMTLAERDKAVEDIRAALRLDPLSPWVNHFAVWVLAMAGEPDAAIAQFQRANTIDPTFAYIESTAGEAYRSKGDFRAALRFDSTFSAAIHRPSSGLIVSLAKLGRRADAERALAETVRRLDAGDWTMPELVARGSLALGRVDQTIDLLEKGLANQSGGVTFLPWISDFRALLGNPRFESYLERANLKGLMR